MGAGFGICQINLHPFDRKQIESACSKIVASYSTTSKDFIRGLHTELHIRELLNDFAGVQAWRTPDGSYADCTLKWDLIVEVKNNFYVLQIKSSQEGAIKFIDKHGDKYRHTSPTVVWAEYNYPYDDVQLKNALSELFGGLSLSCLAIARQIAWTIMISEALRKAKAAVKTNIQTKQQIEHQQQKIEEEKILLADPTIALAYQQFRMKLREQARVVKAHNKEVSEAYYQKLAEESVFF